MRLVGLNAWRGDLSETNTHSRTQFLLHNAECFKYLNTSFGLFSILIGDMEVKLHQWAEDWEVETATVFNLVALGYFGVIGCPRSGVLTTLSTIIR